MFSPVLFRFSEPNYCLTFLFLLSSFHHLPCALSQGEDRLCDNLYDCGSITAGFPFWGEARPQPCGHPSLGLRCNRNSTSTYLIISGLMYRVLQLNLSASTLKLARQDFLGEFCNSSFSGETLTHELFELLPDYKTLFVNYICDPAFNNPTNFTCPKTGVAFVHENDDYHGKCGGSFNITVPRSYAPEKEALNITHLGNVLKKGFDVKLKIDEKLCQECKSSGRKCAYEAATPVCKNRSSSQVTNIFLFQSSSVGLLAVLRHTLLPSELKRKGRNLSGLKVFDMSPATRHTQFPSSRFHSTVTLSPSFITIPSFYSSSSTSISFHDRCLRVFILFHSSISEIA